MITQEDIDIMEACALRSYKELADWWGQLNAWNWPKELPNEEECAFGVGKRPRRSALMGWMEDRIGNRVISRVWNDDMTDDEHEDFWRRNENEAAHTRYWKKVTDKIKRNWKRNRRSISGSSCETRLATAGNSLPCLRPGILGNAQFVVSYRSTRKT